VIPPEGNLGEYYIVISYKNNEQEYLSCNGSHHCTPEGEKKGHNYYFLDQNEYLVFINKWVGADALPT
jgi:hypothetical protein